MNGVDRNATACTPFRVEQADADHGRELHDADDCEADFTANIDERMELYQDAAEGQPIKAYINVGGGMVSVGKNIGKLMFQSGP